MAENVNGGSAENAEEEENTDQANLKKTGKDKDGDEEMTVVVPPSKAMKVNASDPGDGQGDVKMNGSDEQEEVDDSANQQAKAGEGKLVGVASVGADLCSHQKQLQPSRASCFSV